MLCPSCLQKYEGANAGTCNKCYEEAREREEELKREIDDLKSMVSFLRLPSPIDSHLAASLSPSTFDVSLHACSGDWDPPNSAPVPAHKAILMSRSPVFKAMLETDMEETRSGSIKISDVSYAVLRAFIHYLYTAEALLDEAMARDLLVLAEKYQVKNLKAFCEKFLISKVDSKTTVASYAFAHRHSARMLMEVALALILDNMSSLTSSEEYQELVEKEPRLVVEIHEAYLSRQLNALHV